MNPYDMSFFDFQGINSYNNFWMPRNLYGIRALAAYDPMMFFSNPYLSSINPMMSPSLFNIHHPGISTYGLCNWTQMKTYSNWIWTNNGTGGGLSHIPGNNHMYISGIVNNKEDKVIVKGPRGGRGGVILKDNFDGVDRYIGRRVLKNDAETYEDIVSDRGVPFVSHYKTPRLRHPTVAERQNLTRIRHVWKSGDRYWKLATENYGNPKYWWVIAWYNKKPVESIVSFLFIALVFYILYFALWVFCPC